jgi:hypothetical protein
MPKWIFERLRASYLPAFVVLATRPRSTLGKTTGCSNLTKLSD